MSQFEKSFSTDFDIGCFCCSNPGNIHVDLFDLNMTMCRDCIINGSIGAGTEVSKEDGLSGVMYVLMYHVNDNVHVIKEVSDNVQFARYGTVAIEYFDQLTDLVFEITQLNSD